MSYCRDCGGEVSSSDKFCPSCGKPQETMQAGGLEKPEVIHERIMVEERPNKGFFSSVKESLKKIIIVCIIILIIATVYYINQIGGPKSLVDPCESKYNQCLDDCERRQDSLCIIVCESERDDCKRSRKLNLDAFKK